MTKTIERLCWRAGIKCSDGTPSQELRYYEQWGERETAFVTNAGGRVAYPGWRNLNMSFGRDVRASVISEIEALFRDFFEFRWFSVQRVAGRVVFVMTLKERIRGFASGGGTVPTPPQPTSDEWLWFQMPSGGTVTLTRNGSPTAVTLEVSLDNGATWSEWAEVGTARTQTLAAGQVMHVRNASATSTGFSTGTSNNYTFSFDSETKSGGNCNSLLCKEPGNAVLTQYVFRSLFSNASNLKTAPILPSTTLAVHCYNSMFRDCVSLEYPPLLPSTSLANYCYRIMFRGCVSMLESPLLPAQTLRTGCYEEMFYGCAVINKITTQMTDISASGCLTNWCGEASTLPFSDIGDFYCPQSLTIPTGSSGIPTGWTRYDL